MYTTIQNNINIICQHHQEGGQLCEKLRVCLARSSVEFKLLQIRTTQPRVILASSQILALYFLPHIYAAIPLVFMMPYLPLV